MHPASAEAPNIGEEKDPVLVKILSCWNVGALSSEALRTAVTVGFKVDALRRPIVETIQLVRSEGVS